jgi:hypothetical protein
MRLSSPLAAFVAVVTLPALLTLAAGCAAPTDPGSDDENAVSSGEQALTSNERAAYEFFVAKGLTHIQSAGIIGNLIQESNVLPGAVQPGGPGRGIAQWSVGGRWNADHGDNLASYVATHGGSMQSLTTQLDFIWYELETYAGYGLAKLRAATNITSATVVFQQDFEGCGQCLQSTRIRYAEQVLSAYGGGGGGAGGGGADPGCYSATLASHVPDNTCVQARSDRLWYQCKDGAWVPRFPDPEACASQHPL